MPASRCSWNGSSHGKKYALIESVLEDFGSVVGRQTLCDAMPRPLVADHEIRLVRAGW